jgi:hypothetical protein
MVDVSAIAGAASALKGATDIAQALIGLRDAQAMQAKIMELNSKILEAQLARSRPMMSARRWLNEYASLNRRWLH